MKAPIKTGRKQRMQVSHMKGISTHHGPESCLDIQQWCGEALTGESTGAVLNFTITQIRRQTLLNEGECDIDPYCYGNVWLATAESEASCMCGSFLHGNREIQQAPSPNAKGRRVVSMKERTRRIDVV